MTGVAILFPCQARGDLFVWLTRCRQNPPTNILCARLYLYVAEILFISFADSCVRVASVSSRLSSDDDGFR